MAKVLFICLGNMCRSPMAEYFFNEYSGKGSEAKSAGFAPAWESKEVSDVMKEKGISMETHRAKPLDDYIVDWADVIVCMCGRNCPDFGKRTEYWNVDDPYGGGIVEYRKARDDVEKRVKKLIERIEGK